MSVQALQAARVYTYIYRCDKAMRSVLKHQQDKGENEGSFGSILANIQVTPALLGESLISLKNYACPAGKDRHMGMLRSSLKLVTNEKLRGFPNFFTHTHTFPSPETNRLRYLRPRPTAIVQNSSKMMGSSTA